MHLMAVIGRIGNKLTPLYVFCGVGERREDRYEYACCSCPTGYTVLTTGNCDEGAECVACTWKKETLTKDQYDSGYLCVVKQEGVLGSLLMVF